MPKPKVYLNVARQLLNLVSLVTGHDKFKKHPFRIANTKKQILAQQPFLVKAFPFGISRHICFFYEVGLSDQYPQPLLHEEKTLTYPGFEPGTFGYQVGSATN
jgi:hypothetical protein